MDLARREKRRTLLNSLAQQGITFTQLKEAYDEAFKRGQADMVYFRLTFFYAATAIAIREAFNTSADSTAAFLKTMLEITGQKAEGRDELMKACQSETGVDVSDIPLISGSLAHSRVVQTGPGNRKDRAAVQRMRETGISPEDLEYERDTGYANGWATEFHAASCYAALALALHDVNKSKGEEIEEIIDRVGEIQDEEITVEDIVKRCAEETGVDVSQMARVTTDEL